MDNPTHNKKEPVVENKRSLAYATRTMDPPISLVESAKEIEKAELSIQSHVHSKLDLIAGQIKALQQEAAKIIDEANLNVELHQVKCNFEKKIGRAMYLYRKKGGENFFSMLSPADWGGNPPGEFQGAYVLKADSSFEEIPQDETPE